MKISIVTAVFNRANTIRDAIESVRAQTHPDIEHIIQDGGSTDGTLEIVREATDGSAAIVSERDTGLYDALNKGMKRATGDVIGFMHSDDFFADKDVLAKVAERLKDSSVDGLYGDLDYVSAEDPQTIVRQWRSGPYSMAAIKRGWMPPHPTLYLKREIYDKLGGYDTSFRIAGDYEAMLRYLVQGQVKLAYLPEVMVKMRTGGISNGTIRQIVKKSQEDLRAMRLHKVGGVGTLFMKNASKVGQFLHQK